MHALLDNAIGDRHRPGGIAGLVRTISPAAVVGLITLAAAALRLHDIGLDPFWKNELFSLYWIRNSFSFLLTEGLLTETNPPLHFVLLKAWTGLFGTSEIAVRSLSALASIACIPLIYGLGCRLGSETTHPRRIGLVAAALLALTPAQIVYAQEGRAYALLPLFLLLAMLGIWRYLQPPEVGAAKPTLGLALYVAGAVAMLYSHAIAVFILLALVLAVMLLLLDGASRPRLRGFILANALVALLALPQAVAMAAQAGSANLEWVEPFGLDTLIIASRYVMIGPMVRNDLGAYGSHILLLIEMFLALAASITLLLATRKAIRGRLAMACCSS
jgi:mannosyltransferase